MGRAGLWPSQRQPSCRIFNGNSAVVNAYFDFTTVDKDGKATTVNERETSVYVNATGKWVWANSHYSRIFEGP